MANDPTSGPDTPLNPWDRDFVVNAREKRRRTPPVSPGPGLPKASVGRQATTPAASASRRGPRRFRAAHPLFLLSPWAGIVGLACALFASGAWLFAGRSDLSTAIVVAAGVALALGAYAVAGAAFGRGRADIAAGALVLGATALLLWAWIGRPTPVVTPP